MGKLKVLLQMLMFTGIIRSILVKRHAGNQIYCCRHMCKKRLKVIRAVLLAPYSSTEYEWYSREVIATFITQTYYVELTPLPNNQSSFSQKSTYLSKISA